MYKLEKDKEGEGNLIFVFILKENLVNISVSQRYFVSKLNLCESAQNPHRIRTESAQNHLC